MQHFTSKEEAYKHWIDYGKNENRIISYNYPVEKNNNIIFDWKSYINSNYDLQHIKTEKEAYEHWINYGKNEGRVFFDKKCLKITNFDWKYYIKNNNDLEHIKTKEYAWNHWNEYGKNENRLFKKKDFKNNSLFNLSI